MNILAIDFKRKKLIKSIPTKKEYTQTRRFKEQAIEQFVEDMKEGLTLIQYMKVLEGIVSIRHYKKIKNKQLAAICLEYGLF